METDSSDPHWSEKEQPESMFVPLMTGPALAQNPGILASVGNPSSYVQADGNRSMSSALVSLVSGALVRQKTSASFPN